MDKKLKSIFLSLYCMVVADGIVSPKELETLYRIGREQYKLSQDEVDKYVLSAGTSFEVPDELEEKVRILYNMAQIAWADGEIDDTERSLLGKYVVHMGFKEENAKGIVEFMLQCVKDKVEFDNLLKKIQS